MSTLTTSTEKATLTDPPALLVRDPICGMEFNPAGAAASRTLDGQTYYFCAATCAAEFDQRHAADEGFHHGAQDLAGRTGAGAAVPRAPGWLVPLLCAVAVAAILAVGVFGVPLNTLFVYGLVLLCPLMHLFMMRGHGGHGGHGDHAGQGAQGATQQDGGAQRGSQGGRHGCH